MVGIEQTLGRFNQVGENLEGLWTDSVRLGWGKIWPYEERLLADSVKLGKFCLDLARLQTDSVRLGKIWSD